MVGDGGTFAVPVTINNQLTLKFVIDSGASDVSIPRDVVSTLVRTGTIADTDFLGSQTYKLADGSTVPSQRFLIRSLKVGNRTLENVTANIEPIAGQLLLGQSFLRRFKSWSIDNGRSALILNGDPTASDGSQPLGPSLSGLDASPGSE
jgi:clan AA aspartic protease (TIGR02281 family)